MLSTLSRHCNRRTPAGSLMVSGTLYKSQECVFLTEYNLVLGVDFSGGSRPNSRTLPPTPSASPSAAIQAMPAAFNLKPASSIFKSHPVHWLASLHHFSFADYHDPKRMSFGALRVVNDDIVAGNNGFGRHPHRDAEIFSYIIDGKLTHKDSMGNHEALGRGCVQYLSAGTGISHSEMNEQPEPCRFLQVWLSPDRHGHTPQYGSHVYSQSDRHNRLLHLLGGVGYMPAWKTVQPGAGIKLHQDANVYVSESDADVQHEIELAAGRQAYVIAIEGSLAVNDAQLQAQDALEMVADSKQALPLTLTAGQGGCHFMLIDMAAA